LNEVNCDIVSENNLTLKITIFWLSQCTLRNKRQM